MAHGMFRLPACAVASRLILLLATLRVSPTATFVPASHEECHEERRTAFEGCSRSARWTELTASPPRQHIFRQRQTVMTLASSRKLGLLHLVDTSEAPACPSLIYQLHLQPCVLLRTTGITKAQYPPAGTVPIALMLARHHRQLILHRGRMKAWPCCTVRDAIRW